MAQHWIPFYIGDYDRDTMDLTLEQHGAYIALLKYVWATGTTIPLEMEGVYRIARAFTDTERRAVEFVLKRFFKQRPDGYQNKKAEQVHKNQLEKSEKAKQNISARWGKNEKSVYTSEYTDVNTVVSNPYKPTEYDGNTNQNQSQNQNQIQNQTTTTPKPPPSPPIEPEADGSPSRSKDLPFKNRKLLQLRIRGDDLLEDEWVYRCLLAERRAKKQSTMGCDDIFSLMTLYPNYMHRWRRWLAKPDEERAAAIAYVHIETQADDPFRYALKVLDDGMGWEKFQPYLQNAIKLKDTPELYEVTIHG